MNAIPEERWLPIPGYEGHYEVSDQGQVRSRKYGRCRVLHVYPDTGGYPHLGLHLDGVKLAWCVHRLVMLAFVGPRPSHLEIRHLDGDVGNARLDNLTYGTKSENAQDTLRHGNNWHKKKTHCPQGHAYSAENTYHKGTRRVCIACSRAADRARRARVKAARSEGILL